MPETRSVVELVKTAALEAVETTKPVNFLFGVVASTDPLEVQVDQKMTLYADSLVLTRNVTDHTVPVTIDEQSEAALGEAGLVHVHAIRGRKTLLIHNALKAGDRVLLARAQGGKKFVVLDRLEE